MKVTDVLQGSIESTASLEPGRATFEAWCLSLTPGLDVSRDASGCAYNNPQTNIQWAAWQAAWDVQQAAIDRLMLEYCPDEMTPEQIAEWGRHQTSSDAIA